MPGIRVRFRLNGEWVQAQGPLDRRLIDVLRLDLGLPGPPEGCGRGECGSCLMLLNQKAVNACLLPLFAAAEAEVLTAEGIAGSRAFSGLPAWLRRRGLAAPGEAQRCGRCSPGRLVALAGLYLGNPEAEAEELAEALSGNWCSCGTIGRP
jgi:aerobic-type carbon monoxide dehydrogenase small subunit (CoxS/CutS family)